MGPHAEVKPGQLAKKIDFVYISKMDCYNTYQKTLAFMRIFTKKEIVRLGINGFAISILILQNLLHKKKKKELRNMMTCNM